jgi:hypothetical protein
MTATLLNTTRGLAVNGNGHYARQKSSAACDAANLLDEILAKHPDSNVNALMRALAGVLGVSSRYIGIARHLRPEQRDAVQRGERPVITPHTTPESRLAEVVAEIGVDRTANLLSRIAGRSASPIAKS